jgi:hypothetical protein
VIGTVSGEQVGVAELGQLQFQNILSDDVAA